MPVTPPPEPYVLVSENTALYLCMSFRGVVSTLRMTVAGSLSTPLSVGEVSPHKLLPFPWTAGFSRPSPAPYTRVHLSRGGKLLHPLRTNLGYYESSVALQVRPTARWEPA